MHLARFFIDPWIPPAGARAAARPAIKDRHSLALCATLGFALALLTTPACGKKRGSPNWDSAGQAPAPAATHGTSPRITAARKAPAAAADSSGGLRFVIYNVKNWLTMDRGLGRKDRSAVSKPAAEKRAVIQLLSLHAPDVIGICEIGTREDLAEFQAALSASGVDLPHSHFSGGGDEVRHLGLLSRFPITSTATPATLDFKLNGSAHTMNRGILDTTIQAHGKSYRLLGVHLKSKREVADGDQEAVRLCEARLLRHHVDAILTADPAARLVVYGDFNDTRGSVTLKIITGNSNEPTGLTAVPAADRQGERWTHFWELQDIYSRLDYITVTQNLKHEVNPAQTRILDDPQWSAASDHRPVLAVFN